MKVPLNARSFRLGLFRALVAAVAGAVVAPSGSRASSPPAEPSPWRITLQAGQWAHENLADLPVKGATRKVQWRNQFILGAGLSRVLLPELGIPVPGLRTARLEFETRLVAHAGVMFHPEVTAAFVLRSPDINLWSGLRMNLAVGEGLSFTFSEPTLESVRRGRQTQRLLNYLAFEAEFAHASYPGVYVVPQVHHRSGVYGLIGPSGDGSNYVGLGVRFDLR